MKLIMLFGISVFWATNVWGLNLDDAIKIAAREKKIKTGHLEAIAYIESSGGKNGGLHLNKNGSIDIGPFQINSVHWATTCANLQLTEDLDNARCAARLLSIAQKHAATDARWLGRYHSKSPSRKTWYYNKIMLYLNKQLTKE